METRAIGHLEREHRLIERVLQRTETACRANDAREMLRSLEFFTQWVEGVHHRKEEEVLFPALREWALGPSHRALHVLLEDHRDGRALLEHARSLARELPGGSPEVVARLGAVLEDYTEHLFMHLHREDMMLFRLAERVIPEHADVNLLVDMRTAQRSVMSDAEYLRFGRDAELEPVAQEKLETLVVRTKGVGRPREAATPLDARNLSSLEHDTADEGADETRLGAKGGHVLFDDGRHRNLLLKDFGRGLSVQANQFLIVADGEGMILDPGGPKVYPDVLAQTMLHVGPQDLKYIFLSHQDPDIGTSLNAWLMDTDAVAYISRLWVRFLPHFGIDALMEERLRPIPDEGLVLTLGRSKLVLVPSHFLHSPGCFQVYDPSSKVLFSGDLGASTDTDQTVAEDFDAHARRMLGFHQRYMASRVAAQTWAKTVRRLDIETIAPQHGAMLKGRAMVKRFIDWVEETPCGTDLLGERYQLPTW